MTSAKLGKVGVRSHRGRLVALVGLALLALGLLGAVASAGRADALLGWKWPNKVDTNSTFPVSSNDPCPPVPAGDIILVRFTESIGGVVRESVATPANADGSWQFMLGFAGPAEKATLSAACEDLSATAETPYAQYAPHQLTVTGS
jgi:hypothetical protein